MCIKTTLSHYFILARMIITSMKDNMDWQGFGVKKILYFQWEQKIVQPLQKNSMEVFQKTKTRII